MSHLEYQLRAAATQGNSDQVQKLLERGANANAADEDGWTPLMLASQNGHMSTASVLLTQAGDVNAAAKDGTTALMVACQNGHAQTASVLVAFGADVNAVKEGGRTALMLASQNGHTETASVLLAMGADVHAAARGGWTSLMMASENGHTETVSALLAMDANVNAAQEDGTTSLMLASQQGYAETASALLAAGAAVNAVKKNGVTSLYKASKNGHTELAQVLLAGGADVNMANEIGATSLMIASKNGHTETAGLLLAKGANVNASKKNGVTSLFMASQHGHTETVNVLLANGANVDAANENGATSLYMASQKGHTQTASVLLANGADVNATHKSGATPLYSASFCGHTETASVLLANGADVNAVGHESGCTTLMGACQEGHTETARLLLANGAKVDAPDKDGVTSFFLAAYVDNMELVALLVEHGADVNVKFQGKTASDVTKDRNALKAAVQQGLEAKAAKQAGKKKKPDSGENTTSSAAAAAAGGGGAGGGDPTPGCSPADVAAWIDRILPSFGYGEKFLADEYDYGMLTDVEMEELKDDLGIAKRAHCKKIIREVKALIQRNSGTSTATTTATAAAATSSGKFIDKAQRFRRDSSFGNKSSSGLSSLVPCVNTVNDAECIAKIAPEPAIAREYAILKHLGKGGGAADFVPGLVGHVKGSQLTTTSGNRCALVLERGVMRQSSLAQTLAEMESKGAIPLVEKRRLCYTVLSIGDFIARQGIVWGDVKPGNFVYFRDRNLSHLSKLKAIDFDSSCRDSSKPRTADLAPHVPDHFDHTTLFTAGYICPERARSLQQAPPVLKADAKQDAFALGLVCYRILASRDFFENVEPPSAYLSILQNQGKFETALEEKLKPFSSDVRKVLAKLLAYSPKDRALCCDALSANMFSGQRSIRASTMFEVVNQGLNKLELGQQDAGKKLDQQLNATRDLASQVDETLRSVKGIKGKLDELSAAEKKRAAVELEHSQQIEEQVRSLTEAVQMTGKVTSEDRSKMAEALRQQAVFQEEALARLRGQAKQTQQHMTALRASGGGHQSASDKQEMTAMLQRLTALAEQQAKQSQALDKKLQSTQAILSGKLDTLEEFAQGQKLVSADLSAKMDQALETVEGLKAVLGRMDERQGVMQEEARAATERFQEQMAELGVQMGDFEAGVAKASKADRQQMLRALKQQGEAWERQSAELVQQAEMAQRAQESLLANKKGQDVSAILARLEQKADEQNKALDSLAKQQQEAFKHLDTVLSAGFGSLSDKADAGFQLVASLDRGRTDLPRSVLMLPSELGKMQLGKKLFRKFKLKKYFDLWVCDEAPALLANTPQGEQKPPPHEPIKLTLPGQLLTNLAPLLYVLTKLLELASVAGKLAGLPVPMLAPVLGDQVTKRLSAVCEALTGKMDEDALESVQGVVDGMSQALEGELEKEATVEAVHGNLRDKLSPSFEALEALFTDIKPAKAGWEQLRKDTFVKVFSKDAGSVHWVARDSLQAVLDAGYITDDRA